MKFLPRLPELPSEHLLSREEKDRQWRKLSKENPSLFLTLALSMAVSFGLALAATNGSWVLYQRLGGTGFEGFMTVAMAFWMGAFSLTAMRLICVPQMQRALVRVRVTEDGRSRRR